MQKLAAALVAFQSECPVVPYDATNPHFKSRYASMASIHRVIKPILATHGLAVVQFPVNDENHAGCVTRIMHTSGESMEYTFMVPVQKHDPQGACAAVSYARRHGLSGALGLVTDEDEDAESTRDRVAAVSRPNSQPEPRAKKTASPMSGPNKTKLAYAARERIKELGDDSIGAVEIIRSVAKQLGHASEIQLTDADFERAFSMVQDFEPGGES